MSIALDVLLFLLTTSWVKLRERNKKLSWS
jgi:hypothetical protein